MGPDIDVSLVTCRCSFVRDGPLPRTPSVRSIGRAGACFTQAHAGAERTVKDPTTFIDIVACTGFRSWVWHLSRAIYPHPLRTGRACRGRNLTGLRRLAFHPTVQARLIWVPRSRT